MQIKNLSSSHIWRFGQILSSVPETGFSVRHMALHSGGAAEEFRSDVPVILDYVSGMSLLVIYEDDAFELYYLDRLFELHPGVRFSIIALEDSCQIDCYTSESSVLLSVAKHPAGEFQSDTNSLKLNRLCTFSIRSARATFISAASSMRPWSWSMSTAGNSTIWPEAQTSCCGSSRCC